MSMHQGNLLRKVIKNSGYAITVLAEKLEISRTTLYKKFSRAKVASSLFIGIGRIIGHDFSYINEEIAAYMKSYLPIQVKTLRANINELRFHLKILKDSLSTLARGKPSGDGETQLLPESLFYQNEDK